MTNQVSQRKRGAPARVGETKRRVGQRAERTVEESSLRELQERTANVRLILKLQLAFT